MALGLLTLAGPRGLADRQSPPVVNKVLLGGELTRGAVTAAAQLPPQRSDTARTARAPRAPEPPSPRDEPLLSGPLGKLALG